jgi:hypothetical protein
LAAGNYFLSELRGQYIAAYHLRGYENTLIETGCLVLEFAVRIDNLCGVRSVLNCKGLFVIRQKADHIFYPFGLAEEVNVVHGLRLLRWLFIYGSLR